MKDKFTMALTWHNCQSCPPEEHWNNNLVATNGTQVFPVKYGNLVGWYDKVIGKYIPTELLSQYYWADLEQTVRGCSEFKGGENK